MINGNTGVALFFVLSGFLLSIPFWQASKEKQLPSIKNYMTNRAIRVIPIYYLCLFGILALKGFQGSEANLNNIITHVLFLHNLKDYQVMSLNPPFWTLAVEFQFYLLLPLLFLGLSRLNYRNGQVLCFLLIFTVYFAYRSSMFALESWEAWPIKIPLVWPFQIEVFNSNGASLTYSLFAHLPHFLIGVFAASLYRLKTKPSAATEALFWLSAVLIFIILATPLDEVFQMDFGRYNFPVIPLLLGIIVFTAPSTSLARRLLELSAVKWVGLISYGIYLYHYPIQKAGKMLFNKAQVDISQHPFLYLAFTLTVTLITAFISYKLIEKPLMSRFKRHSASTNTAPKHNDARPAQESLTAIDVVRPRTTETAALSGSSETQEPSTKKKTYHRASANKRNRAPKNKRLILLATASVLIIAAILFATPNTPKVNVFQPEWSSSKTPEMIFDHHAHTTYSDGSLSINQLVENAFIGGCDALAITDHSLNGSISTQKFAEISKVRKAYPGLLILSGIELGMPSYKGREHVNIITTPDLERSLLPKIMDALQQSSSLKPQQKDEFVLNTINSITDAKNNTIAIYNHPSRKDKTASENINDINQWNQEQAYITGIAGAPGHQNRSTIGSYFSRFSTQDRWDPAVATVGGTWDQLLQQEQRIWGAIASSDYHSKSMDYDPCAFSRIHVNTPSHDYAGLMQGIKAGTFWADHGQLLSRYDFSVSVEGALQPAYPGAELALTEAESLLVVDISFDKTSRYADDFMRVDIISNCSTGEVTATSKYLQPSEAATNVYLILPEEKNNCYVRSRVVRETPEDNDLSAYSNPVFITF